MWSSGEGQARIGKGWQSRQKASKLKPEPRAYIKVGIDMPTTESISTMVNYNLWVCCNQPRAHPDLRVKYQTFQTKFLCKTINTARFLKLSAFFKAIICPFWFKASKVMTLLTFCINNYRPIDGKTLFSIFNQRYELSICM